jgi:hypothetical protein
VPLLSSLACSSLRRAVYYSDDCGFTWLCYDGDQEWMPREFTPFFSVPGVPGEWMGGGAQFGILFSIGVWVTPDGGISWLRPNCTAPPCPDPFTDPTQWVLPFAPVLPGQVGSDWTATYLWFDPGEPVWAIDASTVGVGFQPVTGAVSGGYGRKVFIKGAAQGQGCWLSTDYDALDLWVDPLPTVQSMNNLSIALSAWGPWLPIGNAPWAPRASAALTPGHDGTYAIFASGVSFLDGQPAAPTFGDVWRIDASICLISSVSFAVCNGHGVPNDASVSCACEPGWAGRTCDNASPFTLLSSVALAGVPDVGASFGPEDKARVAGLGGTWCG